MAKNKLRSILSILIGFCCVNNIQAQESINTYGGNATGNGGTVSYSIGQVLYNSNNGSGGIVAQGVQHAYEIFSVGINETDIGISLNAYPNPTAAFLTLQVNNNITKLSYLVYDALGQLLFNGQIIANQTKINMELLPPASCYLHIVNQENKNIHLFKIIKK